MKFELHKDGLFAVPDDASNGLLIETDEQRIKMWVSDQVGFTQAANGFTGELDELEALWWNIELEQEDLKNYFEAHIDLAKQCNELGEPI